MKRSITTLLLLAGLAVGTHSLRADDMANMPGMNQPGQTNTTSGGTNSVAKPYPLKNCLVSGDKIDMDDKPIIVVYKGQEIRFCCKDCIKDFNKNPDKYMKKLAVEEKKQAAAAAPKN